MTEAAISLRDSYLYWLANETPTSWWHDSAVPDELRRGLLHGAIRRRMGKQMGALMLGAFFGLIHAQPSLVDSAFVVPPLAFLGYLLSLVRERPGGLWACILIHAANNSVAILLKLQPWN